jgi:hypothetical protein
MLAAKDRFPATPADAVADAELLGAPPPTPPPPPCSQQPRRCCRRHYPREAPAAAATTTVGGGGGGRAAAAELCCGLCGGGEGGGRRVEPAEEGRKALTHLHPAQAEPRLLPPPRVGEEGRAPHWRPPTHRISGRC